MAGQERTQSDVVMARRQNLRAWISLHFNGSQTRFLEALAERGIELNQGELSGLLKSKSFGEKKARKLERDCQMPSLFLDGIKSNAIFANDVPSPTYALPTPRYDEWTAAALAIMKSLDNVQKAQMVAKMREYKQFLGPPRDGQALQVAGG